VKQTSESTPLLPEAKSKGAPNGVSPLAISKKPEKPDSLVLGVQKPGVGGALGQIGGQLGGLGGGQLGGLGGSQPGDCARFQNTMGHTTRDVFFLLPISFDMSTNREELTDEKSDSRIKEAESNSSSGPRQHGHSPNLGGCPNGQKNSTKELQLSRVHIKLAPKQPRPRALPGVQQQGLLHQQSPLSGPLLLLFLPKTTTRMPRRRIRGVKSNIKQRGEGQRRREGGQGGPSPSSSPPPPPPACKEAGD